MSAAIPRGKCFTNFQEEAVRASFDAFLRYAQRDESVRMSDELTRTTSTESTNPASRGCGGHDPKGVTNFDAAALLHRVEVLRHEVELFDPTEYGPRQPADGLAPTERLLDPLAFLLANLVARMAGGAAIDGGAAGGGVLLR